MNRQVDTLTDKQLADRQLGIGGSDVAAILGLSPWKSPLDVYLEKTGEAAPTEANERMYWGQRLEGLVADEYARRHDRQVRRKRQTIVHKRYPWMRANIDRIVVRMDRLLECKTTGERNADLWGEPGTDAIPELYMAQVHHYLIVAEHAAIDVAVLIGGQTYSDYTVEADKEIRDMLIDAEHEFWHRHVLAGVPPAPRSVEEAARLWPKHKDTSVIADPEIRALIDDIKLAQAERKQIEQRERELKLAIQERMGEAGVLLDEDGQHPLVTWRSHEASRIDTKALQSEQPDVAAKYTSVQTQRRFVLK